MKHRPRLSAKEWIIAAICLALAAGALVMYNQHSRGSASVPQGGSVSALISPEAYRNEARSTFKDYESFLSGEEQIEALRSRRDELLAMTVSRTDRDLHLQLVLAADALISGDRGEARKKIAALQNSYPWISQ